MTAHMAADSNSPGEHSRRCVVEMCLGRSGVNHLSLLCPGHMREMVELCLWSCCSVSGKWWECVRDVIVCLWSCYSVSVNCCSLSGKGWKCVREWGGIVSEMLLKCIRTIVVVKGWKYVIDVSVMLFHFVSGIHVLSISVKVWIEHLSKDAWQNLRQFRSSESSSQSLTELHLSSTLIHFLFVHLKRPGSSLGLSLHLTGEKVKLNQYN